MLNNYIDLLPEWGGYLTDTEKIHPERFEQFLFHLAVFEEEHFKRRGYEENEPGWQLSSDNEEEDDDFYGRWYGDKPTPEAAKSANKKIITNHVTNPPKKHPSDFCRSYRDFYYESKLGWSPLKEDRDETLKQRRKHVRDYLEGLHWTLHYYHKGCPSWNWYFPHFYSPLSTDMVNLNEFYEHDSEENDEGFKAFKFEQTEPIPSLAQLLSVLPPQSSNLLPKPLGELMIHPSSPIAEYYPGDFETDANGKRQSWEAIVKIPFIDGDVLLDVVNSVIESGEDVLTNSERRRNVRGKSACFVPEREDGGKLANFPPTDIPRSRRPANNRRRPGNKPYRQQRNFAPRNKR